MDIRYIIWLFSAGYFGSSSRTSLSKYNVVSGKKCYAIYNYYTSKNDITYYTVYVYPTILEDNFERNVYTLWSPLKLIAEIVDT